MSARGRGADKTNQIADRQRLSTKELAQNEQAGFQRVCFVAKQHEIIEIEKHDQKVRVLIQAREAGWTREYAPAIEPGLVEDFARVRDEPSLLKFAHKYGHLGYETHVALEERCGGDPVLWVIAHARRVSAIRDALGIIADAKAGLVGRPGSPQVMERLRQPVEKILRMAGVEPAPMGRLEYEGKPVKGLTQISVGTTFMTVSWPTDPIQTCYEAIANMVNPIIRGIYYQIAVGPNESKPILQFQSLLQIIYWRLATQLRGEWRHCKRPDCVQVFLVNDPRQQHCSPRCRNLHKQRELRKRRRSARSGPT